MTTPVEEIRAALAAYKKGCGAGEEEILATLMEKHLEALLDIGEAAVDLADEKYVQTGASHPDLDEACIKLGLLSRSKLQARADKRREYLREEFDKAAEQAKPNIPPRPQDVPKPVRPNTAMRYGMAPSPRTKGGR